MKRLFIALMFVSLFLIQCGGGVDGSGSSAFAGNPGTANNLVPEIKNTALTVNGVADVAFDAGFAGNGTIIAIPDGFDATDCKLTAAAANIEGKAISTSVSINSTTGEVICEKVVQEREELPPETKDCVASYTIICAK